MSRNEQSAADRGEQEECHDEAACGFIVTHHHHHHQAASTEDDAGNMEEGLDTKSFDRGTGRLEKPRVGGMKDNVANRDTEPAGSADLAVPAAASTTTGGRDGVPSTEIAPSISTACVNTDTPTSEESNMDTEPKQEKTESVGLQSGPIKKCENLGRAGDENDVGLPGLTASLQGLSPGSFGSDDQEELPLNLAVNVETCHPVAQQRMCEINNAQRDEEYNTENVDHVSTPNTCGKEAVDQSIDTAFQSKSRNTRCSLKLDLNNVTNLHESQSIASVECDKLKEVDLHNVSYQLKCPEGVDHDRLNHNMDTTAVATSEGVDCSVHPIEHEGNTRQILEPTVHIDKDKGNARSFANATKGHNTTSEEATVALEINRGVKHSQTAQDVLQDRTGHTADNAHKVKESASLGQAPLQPTYDSTDVAVADSSAERQDLGSVVCAGEDVAKWISPASRRLRINPFNNIPEAELNLEICENHFGESGHGPSSGVPGTRQQHIFPEVYVCSKGGAAVAGAAPANTPRGMWRMQDSRSLDGISQLYVLGGARPKEGGRPDGRRATISSALELEGTVTHEGELTHFVADDLLQKIKLSSSRNLDDEAGGAVSRGFLTRRDIPPVDPAVLADLEAQARDLASNVDRMMKSLNTTIQNMTALSVGYIQTYRDSVDSLGESVDLSIKAMYTLMARTEELDKGMQPVHGLAKQIKDVKRLLDHLENLCK
ncbi:BLOC-1-related complex subunit 6 isoform X1 [Lethenteron reissneri]|uniref:BLOC-1-related complex subunit 6 isoform X1 n=1 Tax=Lethenteron reissneri TaxID=7753 RepID=UPI002AB7F075|nr:BLOC-1-related complex subunit 6 isoform X1 [Lethenteron reissneri]